MRNPKTDFNAEIFVFESPFFPFFGEIWKRIWKTVLLNSSLARASIISKKKTTVHDNSFANPFSDFGGRVRLQNLKSAFQNLNPHFPIERNPSVTTFMQSSIITFPHITQRKKKKLKRLWEQPGATYQNKAQKFIFKITQKVKNTNQRFARNEHLNIFTALRWFQRTSVVRRHPA